MFALVLSACSEVPTDATPKGTVQLFLAAMERSEHDEQALAQAYALLSAPTRRVLQERAHLATSLGANELKPWQMLVRGSYRQRFTPSRGARGMRERIEGDRATVTVTNGRRRAEVPLVRENGRWRIVLNVPPRQPD